jgi:hypothetical protein
MNENKKPRWFVYDSYTAAGRPLLETAVMKYAEKKYMYTLVYDLDQVIDHLKKYQDSLWEQNRRTKKADISYAENRLVRGAVFIHIGGQGLRLQQVREDIETID